MTVMLATPLDEATWQAAVWRLGAHLDGAATTFAVHAPAATRVVLELYPEAVGAGAHWSYPLAKSPDGVWRGRIGNVGAGALYAYRCWGENWPFDPSWAPGGSAAGYVSDVDGIGNRFNPNKVMFDPYAREITHNLYSDLIAGAGGDAGCFGTGHDQHRGRARRELDTGPWVPKGIVVADDPWTAPKPQLPAENAAIYEAHVKGLTKHPSSSALRSILSGTPGFTQVQDVPPDLRGTYAGAALLAPYLKALGMTALELLPVHETNTSSSASAAADGRVNYWGYMTLAFFAPNREYAHDRSPGGPTAEFKAMVQTFHDHGIEVYLDVVYNHSAEGGNWGGEVDTTGFVSLGGLACPDYYVLTDALRLVDGATGCGNQLNFSVPATQHLVLDSLAYWADVMGVDGFRFDLAPVLGRTPNAFERHNWGQQRRFFQQHPLLVAIRDFAVERGLEVIAEAWDLWGYEVGNFPSGWGEWNGRYRDAMRGFLKGDGNTQAFLDAYNGDFFHFSDQGGPQRSIDFVTAHDGFTLADLVSYNQKINGQPYPFGPSDGGSDTNASWDSWGDPALRRQRIRNALVVLFFSRGVPMIVSGDEYGRTQNGNNNPWNIDTIGLWNNWAMAGTNAPTSLPVDPDHPELRYHDNLGAATTPPDVNPLLVFTAYVAGVRQRHPGLRQRAYGNSQLYDSDVTYLFLRPDGVTSPNPGDRCVGVYLDCSGVGDLGDLWVLVNMNHDPQAFRIPPERSARPWRRFLDTAAYAEPSGNYWTGATAPVVEGDYVAQPWSIAVLSNAVG